MFLARAHTIYAYRMGYVYSTHNYRVHIYVYIMYFMHTHHIHHTYRICTEYSNTLMIEGTST